MYNNLDSKATYKDILLKLINHSDLTFDESRMLGNGFLNGDYEEVQMTSILTALKIKGETVDEIAGFAKALKDMAIPITPSESEVFDTCGTGGDGSSSFNISTTVAFVLAGGGVPIGKHGNRSISSKCGSADVLKELGVDINCSKSKVETLIDDIGISFLFAPSVHPKMKNVMDARIKLGIPTIFNMIGPLCNPISLAGQVIGVYDQDLVPKLSGALVKLGVNKGIVIHGYGKIDELSLEGPNQVSIVDGDSIIERTIDAKDLGLAPAPNSSLEGGDLSENAQILLEVLGGLEKGPKRDVVLLNSALGFMVSGKCDSLEEGLLLAKESIDSGNALEKLELLIKRTSTNIRDLNTQLYM